jgi:hypothetical protein
MPNLPSELYTDEVNFDYHCYVPLKLGLWVWVQRDEGIFEDKGIPNG